jgi:hypothetical protein
MGFLDKAKKFAEQAKDMATDAMEKVKEQQAQQAQQKADQAAGAAGATSTPASPTATSTSASAAAGGNGFGTPAGELGERWKSIGLTDPAGFLPAKERAKYGVPASTKSTVVSERWGIGRRWTAGDKSVALLYLIDPADPATRAEQTAERWGNVRTETAVDVPDVGDGAFITDIRDGKRGVFARAGRVGYVVEFVGIGDDAAIALARAAAANAT